MISLPKAYEPGAYEKDLYARWESSGFFNPDVCIEQGIAKPDAPPFCIILPPPNVTGTLHIGHAVMLAIEDVMIRYHRMKGDRTLWVPGTDHAAIATQEKVEKIMWNDEKKTRHDLGREAFLERVNAFAQASHDTIITQAKRMGTSMDWSREYYSLDDARNLAVRTTFKKMYDAGLIYRGDRIVNWDPKMQSNVSNIEVVRKEEKAQFYYMQYGPFVIGTARPETKFGDKYVVMHPDDARYAAYHTGDTFTCEWINGPITATIIKDEHVDPSFGTGVMTITPWHDANDFDIAERHGLDKEQVIDFDGKLMDIAGEFAGMPIAEAREKIVKKMQEKGLIVNIDTEYVHELATNSRGGGVIEPQIMKQWWISVDKKFTVERSKIDGVQVGDEISIQEISAHVVKSGQIQIIPERFEKNYFNWIDNYRDWCISRQLWFGHRIPAWYCENTGIGACDIVVAIEDPATCPSCGGSLTQDPDTLDTWFSAGLFSFSPLGWPNEDAPDLTTYHPTSVLETGYDILTFWVIRMILMSTYVLGEVPFEKVYLHGLVRDEHGNKMSKSLGNIINPLDMCDRYGTDATRLSLLIGATPGNDSRLSEEKIAGYRNFTNKLWNISRYMLMHIDAPQRDVPRPEGETVADRWILATLDAVIEKTDADIAAYQFSLAGERLRDFTWNDLADWYLEIAKIEGDKTTILNYILNTILALWHPYMPFVTEAIWQEMYGTDVFLMVESFPKKTGIAGDDVEVAFMHGLLRDTITALRALRAEKGIPPAAMIAATIVTDTYQVAFDATAESIRRLARLESLTIAGAAQRTDTMASVMVGSVEVIIDTAGALDPAAEKARLEKELARVEPYVLALEKKLGNAGFVDNAPTEVVQAETEKLREAKEQLEKLRAQYQHIA